MKKLLLLVSVSIFTLISCEKEEEVLESINGENLQAQTANPNATELTKTVFNNLMKIQNHDKIIFGQ